MFKRKKNIQNGFFLLTYGQKCVCKISFWYIQPFGMWLIKQWAMTFVLSLYIFLSFSLSFYFRPSLRDLFDRLLCEYRHELLITKRWRRAVSLSNSSSYLPANKTRWTTLSINSIPLLLNHSHVLKVLTESFWRWCLFYIFKTVFSYIVVWHWRNWNDWGPVVLLTVSSPEVFGSIRWTSATEN